MTDLGDKLKAMRAAREAAGEEFLDWDEIRAYKEGWLDECRELKSLRADNERLRGLLGTAHALICQAVASRNNGGMTTTPTHDEMRAWLLAYADRATNSATPALMKEIER